MPDRLSGGGDAAPTAEASAGAVEALMQFLYQTPIGVVQTTLDGAITMINPMSARLLMPLCPRGDLDNLFEVLRAVAPGLRAQAAVAAFPGGVVCQGLQVTVAAVQDGAGDASGGGGAADTATLSVSLLRLEADLLMCSVSDVTAEVQQARQRLAAGVDRANRTDALTALPNRAALLDRIGLALARARTDAAHRFTVFCVNADRFNHVNVTLGPACGDDLLRAMGERIAGAVRPRDVVAVGGARPGGDAVSPTAGRLGMDEFVVVLDGVGSDEVAVAVAQRLVDALSQPYSIRGRPVHTSASVGIVVHPCDAADASAVLQDAGLAMREAKRGGGARWSRFDPALKVAARERASIEEDLRRGLEQGQLFVVFQPIVWLHGGGAAGVEALVRWRHPVRGLVPPVEFIGIAEATGLIGPLGLFVLRTACREFARWQHALGARAPKVLSVNLSRAQLGDPKLVEQVRGAIADHGLAPASLQLEITESLAAENTQVQLRLHELKALGATLALDDFGTGYSSLSSLHQWPVDVIKIDRSFVTRIATSEHHRVLVDATVRVAASLGMDTVAEGVETPAQAAVLRALGCTKAQGYLYARPLTAEAAAAWLASTALAVGMPIAVGAAGPPTAHAGGAGAVAGAGDGPAAPAVDGGDARCHRDGLRPPLGATAPAG